jgi:hypothetical protein
MAADPLKPDAALLCKLGSIVVHAEELTGDQPDPADEAAIKSLLMEPEVRDWLTLMDKLALLPVKRDA